MKRYYTISDLSELLSQPPCNITVRLTRLNIKLVNGSINLYQYDRLRRDFEALNNGLISLIEVRHILKVDAQQMSEILRKYNIISSRIGIYGYITMLEFSIIKNK